jgi:hypothetical protein
MEDPVIEAVIEQIKRDFEMDDVSALHEMLKYVPKKNLLAYLPEEISDELKKLN